MTWKDELATEFTLDQSMISQLDQLLQMLQEESDRNLTAVTSPAKIIDFHFRDSIALLALPEISAAHSLVDIGSGAGFPGLPLAICRPGLDVTLIESSRRKCSFMNKFVLQSGLANVAIAPIRAETAGRGQLRDHFDVALARAVGTLTLSMEYTAPLVRKDGYVILQRGETLAGEEATSASVAPNLRLALDRIQPSHPYPGAKNLHLWIFRKTGATPAGYPRKPGIAKKRPLA